MSETAIDSRILEGARKVIAERGWSGATLADIAEAAGVSRMTLHRHGVDRAALRGALIALAEAEYREAFWPALVSESSGIDRLRMALRAQCDVEERFLRCNEAVSEVDHVELGHERTERGMTRDAFVAPLRRILSDGQVDGTLAVADAEETATLLFNLVASTYGHLRSAHGWNPRRAADAVVFVAINGVAS